jgi:MoaA/NifB/PqqE/SkfB family radical SAM enzyme
MQGRSVDEYRAPLFLAWQLTNRCSARCLACCEESGPDKAWADELTRDEALALAWRIAESGIPYVAFGGGEPLGVAHCWEIFEILAAAGIALKIETDGSRIDAGRCRSAGRLDVDCIQISVDGATATTQRARPSWIELRRRGRRDRTTRRSRSVAAARVRSHAFTTSTRSSARSISP